ncbi:hypothetical protein VNO77_14690 [Canavalia gladiata]|uniref:Uncharacterized protein n=1 Tax=Canavalia gladiata TaxID=3824 RepID=A0AAN9QS30_CANGL
MDSFAFDTEATNHLATLLRISSLGRMYFRMDVGLNVSIKSSKSIPYSFQDMRNPSLPRSSQVWWGVSLTLSTLNMAKVFHKTSLIGYDTYTQIMGVLRSPGSVKINPCIWYRDTGHISLISSWVKFPLSQNRVCHMGPREKNHTCQSSNTIETSLGWKGHHVISWPQRGPNQNGGRGSLSTSPASTVNMSNWLREDLHDYPSAYVRSVFVANISCKMALGLVQLVLPVIKPPTMIERINISV